MKIISLIAKKKKTKELPNQMEMYRSVRKRMPPATKVIPDKSKYDRKDKDWKDWKENI
jgi:hypothetical protein